jgi:hypothetical protein
MNRSFSKIRHIQEANSRLEKRMLSEQEDDNLFLKRRLSTIEELIDKNIEKVNDEGGYGFSDEFEFGSNIIRWVVDELTNYDYDTYDYDELVDLIKDNFGEYILSQYVEEDFDDEDFDDEDYDDDEDF